MDQIIRLGCASLASSFTTIFGLVMDRSGSMQRFGDAPEKAINEHIVSLQADPNAGNAIGFVIAFADEVEMPIPPQPLADMPRLNGYSPTGCATRLYATVLMALKEMLELQSKARSKGADTGLILTVFTDGQDNASTEEERVELCELSGQALEKGLDLLVVGIGTPGEDIALKIGFPPKCAVTIEAQAAAIHQTMVGVTHRTRMTMTGFGCSVPATQTPPPSSR